MIYKFEADSKHGFVENFNLLNWMNCPHHI